MKAYQLLLAFGVIAISTMIVLAGTFFFLSTPKTNSRSESVPEATPGPTLNPAPTQIYPAKTASPAPNGTPNAPPATISTILTLSIPTTAEADEKVTISSTLTDSNQHPISDASVYYVVPESSGIMSLGQGWTDSNGFTSISFEFTQSGSYQVQAVYSGRSVYFPNSIYSGSSGTKTISIVPKPSGTSAPTLTLFISPSDNVTTKTRLTLDATLEDDSGALIPNAPIIFQWSNDNTTWHHIGVATLNLQGHVEFSYTPTQTGNLIIQAVFNGDANYYPSQSNQILTVTS